MVCTMPGAAVFPDGAMSNPDNSLHAADMPSDITDGESTGGQLTFLRILSVLAIVLFLVWYIRRKMKL